eukprot:scaffold41676_cov63-Phaeocystis_antarctica.AAC.2
MQPTNHRTATLRSAEPMPWSPISVRAVVSVATCSAPPFRSSSARPALLTSCSSVDLCTTAVASEHSNSQCSVLHGPRPH